MDRLFLGIALDGATRRLLAAHLEAHAGHELPGRSVPSANWHLTLRFLGASTTEQAERVIHDVATHALTGALTVHFGGLGAFPKPRRATVLWLGVVGGEAGLTTLASACEAAAVAAGFSAEDRPFHSHLTLSRIRPPGDVSELVAAVPAFDVTIAVEEITMFRSHVGRGGARYEAVERITL